MAKSFIVFCFAVLATLIATGNMFQKGFYSSQDNMHPLRLSDYAACRKDGQVPCRYVNQSGYNCGYPLYNFYAPFSYEVGLSLKTLSFNILDYVSSIKATYIFVTLFGFMGMYLFTKKYSTEQGSVLSAFLYTIVPYKALDLYVRGSLAEYVALGVLPWLLYSIEIYDSKYKKRFFYVAILTISILSHNLFPVLFGPLILFFIVKNKNKTITKKQFYIDSLMCLGLTAFFLLPSILERSLTTNATMTSGYFRYINHFATISQLFISRFWGFGASLWGPVDDMSFQIGHLHWILVAISLAIGFKNKKVVVLTGLFLFYLFLTHNKSTFIWQLVYPLQFLQFPWRFLGPAIFIASFIPSLVFKKNKFIFISIIVTSFFLYGPYFKAEKWDPDLSDSKKFSGDYLLDQQRSGLPDYWPIYGKELPVSACKNEPYYESIFVDISNYSRKTNQVSFQAKISENNQEISLPLVYFPSWKQYINSLPPKEAEYNKQTGMITIKLDKGDYNVVLLKTNTNIEKIANYISIFFILLLPLIYIKKTWLKK